MHGVIVMVLGVWAVLDDVLLVLCIGFIFLSLLLWSGFRFLNLRFCSDSRSLSLLFCNDFPAGASLVEPHVLQRRVFP